MPLRAKAEECVAARCAPQGIRDAFESRVVVRAEILGPAHAAGTKDEAAGVHVAVAVRVVAALDGQPQRIG